MPVPRSLTAVEDTMHPRDCWGPFAEGIDPAERRARLRCLRAIVHLLTAPRGADLRAHLGRAEWDETALPFAAAALDRLASRDRHGVLATYAALNRSI